MSHHVLQDGYQALITFSATGTVRLYQKTVTPPGLDGGGEIDVTTMLNNKWRTRNPKALVTAANAALTVAYDPIVYNDILTNLLNVNNQITITFSDGSTIMFWGWLDKFTPGDMSEGTQPTATVELIPSNHDNSYVEQAPLLTAS